MKESGSERGLPADSAALIKSGWRLSVRLTQHCINEKDMEKLEYTDRCAHTQIHLCLSLSVLAVSQIDRSTKIDIIFPLIFSSGCSFCKVFS